MKREEILESARTCVCTDRNKQYGEPEDNFKAIAEMWMSHIKAKGYDVSITATDVALMLIEFKVARAITAKTPKSDTFIDIAGYAACGGAMLFPRALYLAVSVHSLCTLPFVSAHVPISVQPSGKPCRRSHSSGVNRRAVTDWHTTGGSL